MESATITDWKAAVERFGFAVVSKAVHRNEVAELIALFGARDLRRSRAGVRHAMSLNSVSELARKPELMSMARAVVGPSATPIRATLFDKSPSSNWLVAWHQDTALPVRLRLERPGWGPWSVKDGVNYAHAPARVLREIVALRIHLDDSHAENGPLRVLPGTHELGVLTDDEIHHLAECATAVDCLAGRGGVLVMRPLIVHASSKSKSNEPRCVLHIEYASSLQIDEVELTVA